MAPTFAKLVLTRCHRSLLFVLPCPGVFFVGCTNTCFTVTSNPPSTTVNVKAGNPQPTCTLTTANGTVQVAIAGASLCSSCMGSHRVQHIFVSFAGIAAHTGSVAEDTSPNWQELMPQLSAHPLQVDLRTEEASPPAQQSLGEGVAIPVGIYRQLRLRFVANRPAPDDALPEKNACRGAGFNCVLLEDGRIEPLLLDNAAPELRITPERIVTGGFLILPEATTHLVLDFHVSWALVSLDDQSVQILPILTATASIAASQTVPNHED